MLKLVLQAAVLGSAVLAAVPASVAAQERRPDTTVRYNDLDLTDAVSASILDRRLTAAVERACPSDNGVRELARLRVIEVCRAAKRAEIAPRRDFAIAAAKAGNSAFAAR